MNREATCWKPDCSFVGCRITVIVKPRLGRIAPRLGPTTIRSDAGHCAGRPTKGFQIIYYANRGARGVDEVTIQNFNPVIKKGVMIRVVITIQ